MIARFDRMQISSVNDTYAGSMKGGIENKAIAVPKKETFKHVFENAKKGNEMAAVLLDEWQKNCKPKNSSERQIIDMINMAADRIFK